MAPTTPERFDFRDAGFHARAFVFAEKDDLLGH
jgi:hypothetical protein